MNSPTRYLSKINMAIRKLRVYFTNQKTAMISHMCMHTYSKAHFVILIKGGNCRQRMRKRNGNTTAHMTRKAFAKKTTTPSTNIGNEQSSADETKAQSSKCLVAAEKNARLRNIQFSHDFPVAAPKGTEFTFTNVLILILHKTC